jgi:RNA polymerase sigma-70 factor (ECF subfamily)
VEPTHSSLLLRARGGEEDAWKRLTDLYRPLIAAWLRRQGVAAGDRDDLTQEVLLAVVRHLQDFRPNGRCGAFRSWLRTITANRIRDFWKSRHHQPAAPGGTDLLAMVQQLEDPGSALSRQWDQEHDTYILARLLDLMALEFEPVTLCAFRRVALDGAAAEDVSRELGMTLGAVYAAKSRVLKRIRQEAEGLVECQSD